MTQDEISEIMARVRTLEECTAAWKAREEYLKENPDDEMIIEEGEALSMMEEALKIIAAQEIDIFSSKCYTTLLIPTKGDDMDSAQPQVQVNIRVSANEYQALKALAHKERRSVPQTARLLIERGLRQHPAEAGEKDDFPAEEIAKLALAGGAFDWLVDEPDIYDDTWGEPV